MIHQRLLLERPLICFDLETTGVEVQEARIVEIGFQVWTAEGLLREWKSLVDPCVPIPAGSTEAHGITDERLSRCNDCGRLPVQALSTDPCQCERFKPIPQFKQIAESLARGFKMCDFAGKNVRFDLRVLDVEMRRAGVPWSYAGARVIDAQRLEQLGDPRTLGDLYRKHCGKDPVDAHHALADVRMSAEVIAAQVVKYQMPVSLDALHKLQWPGWLDSEGKFRLVDGVPRVGNWGKHAGKAMRDVPTDYWDYFLTAKAKASPEMQEIARRAKRGEFFPELSE